MSRDFKVGDRVRVDYPDDRSLSGPGVVVSVGLYVKVRMDVGGHSGLFAARELTHIDPPYAPGDKVRVTFEGTVNGQVGGGVVLDDRTYLMASQINNAKSIEVTERAKPAWADRVGAVVMDNGGVVWQRKRATGDWRPAASNAAKFPYSYDELELREGPLTLLYDPAA